MITRQCKELTEVDDEVINGVHVIRWNANTYHTMHKGDKEGYQKFILENAVNYDCMVAVGSPDFQIAWKYTPLLISGAIYSGICNGEKRSIYTEAEIDALLPPALKGQVEN